MNLKAVIFDYGGVLCALPDFSQIEACARVAGLERDEFWKWFWNFRLAYDRGDISERRFWKSIGEANGRVYSDAQVDELIRHEVNFYLTLDETMLAWNRTLRASGYKTAMLSNLPEPLGLHLRRHHMRLLEEFDVVTLSYEVRSAKPEAKIYLHTVERLGVAAGETLFLDDKATNVQAALALGLQAVEFVSRAQFAGREAEYGLPALAV